jgi:CRISPR-associated protein Csy2
MYALIPHIKIKGVNMMQTPSILSPIPVFAANMFAHAVGSRLRAPVDEVGIIFHQAWPDVEYFPSNGTTKTFLNPSLINKRGACAFTIKGELNGGDYANPGKSVEAMSYQPGATATVELSLLLHFPNGFSLDALKDQMKSARIAGGKVITSGNIKVFEDNLNHALANLPSGYWVSDASEVVNKRLVLGASIGEAVLTRVLSSEGIEAGWYVPATLGYSTITDFEQRNGARDGLDHAFAEPVLGLTRLLSASSIKQHETEPKLWKHRWIVDGSVSVFHIHQ